MQDPKDNQTLWQKAAVTEKIMESVDQQQSIYFLHRTRVKRKFCGSIIMYSSSHTRKLCRHRHPSFSQPHKKRIRRLKEFMREIQVGMDSHYRRLRQLKQRLKKKKIYSVIKWFRKHRRKYVSKRRAVLLSKLETWMVIDHRFFHQQLKKFSKLLRKHKKIKNVRSLDSEIEYMKQILHILKEPNTRQNQRKAVQRLMKHLLRKRTIRKRPKRKINRKKIRSFRSVSSHHFQRKRKKRKHKRIRSKRKGSTSRRSLIQTDLPSLRSILKRTSFKRSRRRPSKSPRQSQMDEYFNIEKSQRQNEKRPSTKLARDSTNMWTQNQGERMSGSIDKNPTYKKKLPSAEIAYLPDLEDGFDGSGTIRESMRQRTSIRILLNTLSMSSMLTNAKRFSVDEEDSSDSSFEKFQQSSKNSISKDVEIKTPPTTRISAIKQSIKNKIQSKKSALKQKLGKRKKGYIKTDTPSNDALFETSKQIIHLPRMMKKKNSLQYEDNNLTAKQKENLRSSFLKHLSDSHRKGEINEGLLRHASSFRLLKGASIHSMERNTKKSHKFDALDKLMYKQSPIRRDQLVRGKAIELPNVSNLLEHPRVAMRTSEYIGKYFSSKDQKKHKLKKTSKSLSIVDPPLIQLPTVLSESESVKFYKTRKKLLLNKLGEFGNVTKKRRQSSTIQKTTWPLESPLQLARRRTQTISGSSKHKLGTVVSLMFQPGDNVDEIAQSIQDTEDKLEQPIMHIADTVGFGPESGLAYEDNLPTPPPPPPPPPVSPIAFYTAKRPRKSKPRPKKSIKKRQFRDYRHWLRLSNLKPPPPPPPLPDQCPECNMNSCQWNRFDPCCRYELVTDSEDSEDVGDLDCEEDLPTFHFYT